MKRLLLVVLLSGMVAGCDAPGILAPEIKKEHPTVNLPLDLRQSNWRGPRGEGSCTWATMVSLLRWQARYRTADWIRQNCGDGEWPGDMAERLDNAAVRYAYVTNGDVRFLEWACRTRRGCGITIMGGGHMVALVYLDDKWAALLDNNAVEKYIWIPRETLIAEWKASLGWAITPIYTPAAPLPQ
jgi:hypothetical protein